MQLLGAPCCSPGDRWDMIKALRGPLRKRKSHLWHRHPEDWYVEPAWVSERLFATESFEGGIWDAACGMGRITTAARDAGLRAFGSDLVDRGGADSQRDFFSFRRCPFEAANIVSNPPFRHAERFVTHGLGLVQRKVAMMMPSGFLQGNERSRWLEHTPLYRVYFLSPRPSMPPGTVIKAGIAPGNGTTDYCWMIWLRGYSGPAQISWLRRDG